MLLVLLAILLARLAWQLLTPVGPFGAPAVAPASGPTDAALAARAFSQGGVGSPDAASPADTGGLALFGVRLGADPKRSTAILGNAGGTQASYAVGDTVAPGVTLASVASGYVMLSRGGSQLRLSLPNAPAAQAAAAPLPLPANLPAPTATGAPAAVDAAQLLAQTGLRPRLRGGQADGYTVIPRGDGAMFRRAGLEPGDVLLTVNGQALTPERIAEIDQMLRSTPSVVVTLERGGERKTLTLQMEPP
ncbi:MAG: type II secretion system protein C [Arenimonas sp.]|nr:type II secretion system protein C [Arenimonas sp.]